MRRVRRSAERGHVDHGWLDTRHTFSFASYYDPDHMGFRSLRVINEDRVRAGEGFGTHGHRDMEILSYVISGALQHRDSLGHGSVLRAGEVQRITAGTGILHSEFNPSDRESVHFYQVWIRPEREGLTPGYEQTATADAPRNVWVPIASANGREGAVTIHQDAEVALARLDDGQALHYELRPGRHAWLQVVRGSVNVDGQALAEGDGLTVSEETGLAVRAEGGPAEVLLFDLA